MASNADYIIGGADLLSQEGQKRQDENALLTPTQKWLAEAIAGRVDPREAAMRAKVEHAQQGIPLHPEHQPAPVQGPVGGGPAPMMGAPGMDSGLAGSPAAQMPAPAPQPQPMPSANDSQSWQSSAPQPPQGGMTASAPSPAPMQNPFVMPANNKEYGQLMEGAKTLGLGRPQPRPSTALTFDERNQLQENKWNRILGSNTQKQTFTSKENDKKYKASADRAQMRNDSQQIIAQMGNSTKSKIAANRDATSRQNTTDRVSATRDIAVGKDALQTAHDALVDLKARYVALQAARAKIVGAGQTSMKSGLDPASAKALKQIDADIAKTKQSAAHHAAQIEALAPDDPADVAADNPSPTDSVDE
jgi:hypothetical protein